MQPGNTVIRHTMTYCPECYSAVEGTVEVFDHRVYLARRCPEHGEFRLLISNHEDYYRVLNDFYFSVMRKPMVQRDFIVHVTNRCNLDCPICLAGANTKGAEGEYSIEQLRFFLNGKRNYKIDLMGAEPTMRDDLPDLISAVVRSGNIAALHTNGIKLADFEYCKRLKYAGLHEIHMQFDSLDDRVYERVRGRCQFDDKTKAIGNINKLGIPADLVVTVLRGVNEHELYRILDSALQYQCIREVFFLGCRYLGKARLNSQEQCMMPDEVIDIIEPQARGLITRASVHKFQKLYYTLLSIFSIKKCFYIQHYMVVRGNNGYHPIDRYIDLDRMSDIADRYRMLRIAGKRYAGAVTLVRIAAALLQWRSWRLLPDLLSYLLPFTRGFNLSLLSRRIVLIGFISACDAYSFDSGIAAYCGKGSVSSQRGVCDNGALDNIVRDRALSKIIQ